MFVDVLQNSDEWYNLRKGKITSSSISKIMANYGKAFGEPAKKYAQKIALEIVTNQIDETEKFENKWTAFGHEYEDVARMEYSFETMNIVTNGGFYILDELAEIPEGDSNDGNVGDDGCLEVKCVSANSHWPLLKKGRFDLQYKWQIHNHIRVGDKKWCDFVSFCPSMPKSKQLYIHRVERDDNIISQINDRVNKFKELIKSDIEILLN